MAAFRKSSAPYLPMSSVEDPFIPEVLVSYTEGLVSENEKEFKGVIFLDIPSFFSKEKDILVKFEYVGFTDYTTEDYVGLYPYDVYDLSRPLRQKHITVDEDGKTGSVLFMADEIPLRILDGSYYLMYVQSGSFIQGISKLFIIEGSGDNEDDVVNMDSSDEDFIVISSQQLKIENELRNAVKQLQEKLKHKEEEINTFTHCTIDLNDRAERDKNVIANLRNQLEDAAKRQDILAQRNKELTFGVLKQNDSNKICLTVEKELTDEINKLREALEKSESMLQAVEASKKLALEELKSQRDKYEGKIKGLEIANYELKKENCVIAERVEITKEDLKRVIEDLNMKLKKYESNANKKNDKIKTKQELNDERKELEEAYFVKEEALETFEMMKTSAHLLFERNEALKNTMQEDTAIFQVVNKSLKVQVAESEKRIMELKKSILVLRMKLVKMRDDVGRIEATAAKTIQNNEAVIEDLKKRLLDSAELYKLQFLKIHKLENQVKKLKAKTGFEEQMKPAVTAEGIPIVTFETQSDLSFLVPDMDFSNQQSNYILEDKDISCAKKEEKLPEKCVIRFSNIPEEEDKSLHEKDNSNLESGSRDVKVHASAKDKRIQNNIAGPINDSDTGEQVLKRGVNYELEDMDCIDTEPENLSEQRSVSPSPSCDDLSSDSEKSPHRMICIRLNQNLSHAQQGCCNEPMGEYDPFHGITITYDKCGDEMTTMADSPKNVPSTVLSSNLDFIRDLLYSDTSAVPPNDVVKPISEKSNEKEIPFIHKECSSVKECNTCLSIKKVPYHVGEVYERHCPFCKEAFYTLVDATIMSPSKDGFMSGLNQLWQHLEDKHQKLVCPVCEIFYDCQQRRQFNSHVNTHLE